MYRIIVIEDSSVLRKLLQKTLPPEGYECFMAASAAAGWDLCRKQKPDLILLDVNLPDDNGIALCRRMKEDPHLRHIPILIMTGEAVEVENRIEGLEAGADDYILKPLAPKELLLRIRGLIRKASRPSRE